MQLSLQKILVNKNTLKITALLLGSLTWIILSSLHYHSLTITIPLCFYNHEQHEINKNIPDEIKVTLRGTRQSLRSIDYLTLAAHVDYQEYVQSQGTIKLTNKHLLLPNTVNVVNYKPLNIGCYSSD